MRDKILKTLLENQDDFVSGEVISTRLGVTRAAVWKHIKSLQQGGFDIQSIPNRGYRLLEVPELLDGVTLLARMKTKVLGREVEVHQTIDSTNNRGKELAMSGASQGKLVVAEGQTAGRGRLRREWVSPMGKGIWMSLILRPDISPQDAPRITTIAAVAVKRALNQITGLPIGIKWPNDIILNNKKVCGILTETHAEPDRIHYVIVGIGINANMDRDDFPDEILSLATSLKMVTGQKVDRREVISSTMQEIEEIYFRYIKYQKFEEILDECRTCSMTLGKRVKVIGRDETYEGMALDFSKDGALLVKRDDESIIEVLAGDVSVRGLGGYV